MKSIPRRAALPLAAVLMASIFAQSTAAAVPTSLQNPRLVQTKPLVGQVYWRRGWGWGWGPGWWGPGPAVVGGIIIGGALVASAIAEHRAADAAIRHCAEDFPGFDPRSGTFVNRYGERRVCPYLY
jgi:hypothetical protein